MEWIAVMFGVAVLGVMVGAVVHLGRRLSDIREIMLESEDSLSRISERFEDEDQYTRRYGRIN